MVAVEETIISDVMSEYSATYGELDEVWPWSRVLMFFERITERRFIKALPAYDHMALTINMNRRPGSQTVTGVNLMPEFMVPEALRDPNRGVARYSPLVVEAFEHALENNHVSNGMLAALDVRDLRASGAVF